MVELVVMLCLVRWWCANANSFHHHPRCVWWQRVPRLVAPASVRHRRVPRELRGDWLVELVGVFGTMWRWLANAFSRRVGRLCSRWHCLPGLVGIAELQHTPLPGRLPGVAMVVVVGLLSLVRRR